MKHFRTCFRPVCIGTSDLRLRWPNPLRTSDWAEIYVDGELLNMNFNDEGLHEEHGSGDGHKLIVIKKAQVTED